MSLPVTGMQQLRLKDSCPGQKTGSQKSQKLPVQYQIRLDGSIICNRLASNADCDAQRGTYHGPICPSPLSGGRIVCFLCGGSWISQRQPELNPTCPNRGRDLGCTGKLMLTVRLPRPG